MRVVPEGHASHAAMAPHLEAQVAKRPLLDAALPSAHAPRGVVRVASELQHGQLPRGARWMNLVPSPAAIWVISISKIAQPLDQIAPHLPSIGEGWPAIGAAASAGRTMSHAISLRSH